MIKKILTIILEKISKFINEFFFNKNYLIIYRNGSALGDNLMITSLLKQISSKKIKILIFTNNSELFLNNPRIYKIFQIKKNNLIWFILKGIKGKAIYEFNSIHIGKMKDKHFMFYHKKNIHIIESMSEHFLINLDYNNIKNEFFFSQNEIDNFEKELKLPDKFSVIHSQSKQSFTKNKEWSLEGVQNIINNFKNINWIQLGTSEDSRLQNCQILFDLNIRKVAYIVSKCKFLVCYEGFFNHLASCFDKKTFLIHTGFLPQESFKYKNNIIIENNENINCYPCYDLICKNHEKQVLRNITSELVLNKIKKNLETINEY